MSKYVRYIDAEEFRDDIFRQSEFIKVDDFQVLPVVDVAECLDNAPTVKAIPIDELFKFIDSRVVQPDGTVKYTEDITHLQAFISDWRMDNEEGYRDEVNRWWAEHSSRFD